MPTNNIGGREMAIIALVVLILGVAANELIPILFVAAVLYVLARMYDQRNHHKSSSSDNAASRRTPFVRDRAPEVVPSRSASAETVYRHALDSVTAAGLDPNDVKVLPVDIGIVVFRDDEVPAPYRTHPVPDNADYIQPFVQLRLP